MSQVFGAGIMDVSIGERVEAIVMAFLGAVFLMFMLLLMFLSAVLLKILAVAGAFLSSILSFVIIMLVFAFLVSFILLAVSARRVGTSTYH